MFPVVSYTMHSTFYYNSRYLRTKFILSCIFLLYSLLSTKSGRIFPLDEEGNLQCNPRTKHLFGRFILQRFFDARQELGMENLRVGISDFISILSIPTCILTIYSHSISSTERVPLILTSGEVCSEPFRVCRYRRICSCEVIQLYARCPSILSTKPRSYHLCEDLEVCK